TATVTLTSTKAGVSTVTAQVGSTAAVTKDVNFTAPHHYVLSLEVLSDNGQVSEDGSDSTNAGHHNTVRAHLTDNGANVQGEKITVSASPDKVHYFGNTNPMKTRGDGTAAIDFWSDTAGTYTIAVDWNGYHASKQVTFKPAPPPRGTVITTTVSPSTVDVADGGGNITAEATILFEGTNEVDKSIRPDELELVKVNRDGDCDSLGIGVNINPGEIELTEKGAKVSAHISTTHMDLGASCNVWAKMRFQGAGPIEYESEFTVHWH
ncbi:hypothetical protein, partial [Cedecea neteri]